MKIMGTIKFVILPVIGLPVLLAIGSQGYYWTIAAFIAIVVLLIYVRISIESRNSQTKFFLSWVISSVIYLCILFVLNVHIDNYYLVPREQYALATIAFGAMLFFHLAKRKSKRKTSVIEEDELQGVTCYTRYINCFGCHRSFLSSGPSICTNCQPLMGQWRHYCIWLSCYINERNHFFLLLGHTFAAAAFFFGAHLVIINVCQPAVILEKVEMNFTASVNCSQAYAEPETAVNFMGAIYAAMMGLYCTIILIHQICQLFIEKMTIFWCRSTLY